MAEFPLPAHVPPLVRIPCHAQVQAHPRGLHSDLHIHDLSPVPSTAKELLRRGKLP